MANQLPVMGELETRVLRLVLEHQPCSERSIWDIVRRERDVTRTTVLKTFQRLEAKGAIRRRPGSSPILWETRIEKQNALRQLIRRFVDHVLGGSAEPLAAYLAEQDDLSTSDIAALQRIARKMAQGESAKGPKE